MRVAFISMHTSPAERAGTADAGGMNVLIRALATALQQTAGVSVEFFTRRSSADQPATATLDDGLIVHHIDAGPATPLPKSEIDQHIDEFRSNLRDFLVPERAAGKERAAQAASLVPERAAGEERAAQAASLVPERAAGEEQAAQAASLVPERAAGEEQAAQAASLVPERAAGEEQAAQAASLVPERAAGEEQAAQAASLVPERAAGEEQAAQAASLVPERAAGEERAAQHDEGPPSIPARFDLVHSHHWMSGVAAIPLAREAGIPHVMTYHSVAAHPNSPLRDGEPPESPARLDGEVYCARESDLILAVSHHEAAVVIGRCQADPDKVAIVRPGVDIELFHPAQPGDEWTPAPTVDPGYVLFAARLQPLKGPDLAIRTLALIPARERPHLVIVGQVSEDFAGYEAELHELVSDMGLQGKVTFLPGQDRESFAQTMRHASVLLVPSHSETFGLVALEASASGVPVLAAAAGGLTEAICNTHTGLLLPTHNPHAWAAELLSLLRDPERRAELGRTGRQRAEGMTWAHTAQHTVDNYRRVLAVNTVKRVAFVHAHPDDETLASGALIAHLADQGVAVSLLTATRGEMGQVVPGPLSALAGTPELERRREAELAGAVDALGVTHHAYLGMPPARATGLEPRRYLDSGMEWISDGLAGPAETSDERSLYAADAAEAVADIAAFLRRTRAEFAVSYDDDGGYGHPDHVRLHHLTRAAAEMVGIPYASLTTDEALATTWVELERYRPRVAEALRHHRTQLTVHDEHHITHSGGQDDTIITSTGLRGTVPRLP